MALLKWNDNYSVGVSEIDNEHVKLINMINKAYTSVEEMNEEEVLVELVNDMREYAMTHFATEEKLMEKYNYPDKEKHKSEHNDFMIHAASSGNLLASPNAEIDPIKVFKYLADWLKKHILITDKELGKFLISQQK